MLRPAFVQALALLIALAVALAPGVHRAPPSEVPAWVLADLCGETEPDGHSIAPCPFCLLHAQCALLAAPGAAPIRLAHRPLSSPLTPVTAPPSPHPHHRPPLRGPPDQPVFA